MQCLPPSDSWLSNNQYYRHLQLHLLYCDNNVANITIHSIYCINYFAFQTLHSLHCIHYIAFIKSQCIAFITLHSLYLILYIAFITLHLLHCIHHIAYITLHYIQTEQQRDRPKDLPTLSYIELLSPLKTIITIKICLLL